MALDDIKKAILAEAEKEAKKIEQEGEQKIGLVNNDWLKKIEARKKDLIASSQRKANQKVQQTQFKLQAQAQTEILDQKQKDIDKVYKITLDKLAEIDDDQYVELMEKLIKQLPAGEGSLISVNDKDSLLKKALRQSSQKYDVLTETTSGNGGFIFRSKEVEIDNTFATLVRNAKEQTILEVSSLLFNQEQE